MLWIVLADIALLLGVGAPIFLVYRRWKRWVDRLSDYAESFEKPRRFGFRSWAARSFVLDITAEQIKQQLDSLTELTLEEATSIVASRGPSKARQAGRFSFAGLASLSGQQTFPTGIEVDWTDSETAELQTQSYADWPLNPEDDARLPAKQRQMLFRHAVIHAEPQGEGRSRVSYELEVPIWAYVMSGMILLLIGWAGWILWHVFAAQAHIDPLATRLEQLNITLIGAALAWISTRMIGVLRLQSISLFENVISTFGRLVPRGE